MKYIEYNMNPKNKKTGDCVVRSISFATNKKWEKVLENEKRAIEVNRPREKKRFLDFIMSSQKSKGGL